MNNTTTTNKPQWSSPILVVIGPTVELTATDKNKTLGNGDDFAVNIRSV